ncbi:Nucleoporin-like isoform X1, partial [Aphelenchoides avenae]
MHSMQAKAILHSPESKQFQAFAALHAPVDICLMALNIICSDSYRDAAIKDSALHVFFEYGGEPQTIHEDPSQYRRDYYSKQPQVNSNLANVISWFKDLMRVFTTKQMSTRASAYSPYDSALYAGAQVEPSNRCDALNTYFARIMGPVWGRMLPTMSAATGGTLQSALSKDEVSMVLRQVVPLLKSIDEHALIKPNPPQHLHGSPASDAHAIEQERLSLQQLREFIELTKESLALWVILLENQFHAVAQMLPIEIRQMLSGYTFAEFVASYNR